MIDGEEQRRHETNGGNWRSGAFSSLSSCLSLVRSSPHHLSIGRLCLYSFRSSLNIRPLRSSCRNSLSSPSHLVWSRSETPAFGGQTSWGREKETRGAAHSVSSLTRGPCHVPAIRPLISPSLRSASGRMVSEGNVT